MKHALLGGLSALLLPFTAHAATTSAGGYLMRGGYQPRSYMRVDADAGSAASLATKPQVRRTPPVSSMSGDIDQLDIFQQGAVTELVVVDGSVADRAALARGLRPGVAMVEIDAGRPGLPQLVEALRGYHGLKAIHVVSHAQAGALQLGSSLVDAGELHRDLGALAAVRDAVREGGDLLFYGCDLAANEAGEALLDIIRSGTGLDVAASDDLTGNGGLGGDWTLEIQRGDIEAGLAFSARALRDFSGVLAAANGLRNFSGFTDNGTSLVDTDFDATARSGMGATLDIRKFVLDDSLAYAPSGWSDAGNYFYVKADGLNTTQFELTALTAGEAPGYSAYGIALTNVRVVGIRTDGGTITSSAINGTTGVDDTFGFSLASFAGVKLKGFKLYFDCEGGCNAPVDEAAYMEFRNFTVVNATASPSVSDSRITISGASGTGGAYRIGDTVSATWNNTAGGDNNTGINGVTVDFSQFGGGAAVAASNSNGIWTATYTLTSGAIDTTNRNVSVTAMNGASNTTTADTSNATVDTIAPTLTDGRISIAGANGTGGAYRIGDTVTATWNNTAGGDNNSDTISGVTVDFSQFGGGSAVSATNSAGTWTATYTIVAGAIDATNRNVSVSARDNAGNTTATADTTNAVVDNIAPTVNGITPVGGAVSSDTTVDFTVTFSEAVSNISTDDFAQVVTGSAAGTIASVSASSGDPVTVTVGAISGSGTLKLNLNGSTNIVDDAGNSIAAYSSGTPHTVNILTAPDAPTIGSATAGDGRVSVTFTAPASNGGSAITTYTATASPGGAFGTCAGPAACTATVTGLTNGTAYTFTVTGTNAIGTSTASAASNSATPKANQTITFPNPGAQNFGTGPDLGSTATASSGLPESFTSSTTGVCTVTSGGELTFVTAGSCTIDADQGGDTVWNAATTVSQTFTVNAVVPGAPTIGTATAGDTQATVTFTAPASSGGAAILAGGYTVTAHPGGATGTGSSSPITITGLTNGLAYTFTVTATNSAGEGAESAASNSITPAAPQSITFANPGTQNFGTTPTLTATSSAGGGYSVSFTSSTTGVCTITAGGALTFITVGSCTINADQAGDSSFLPAPQVPQSFTVNPIVPGAPGSAVATAGDTQASIAFVAPLNTGGSAITGYTVSVIPADVAPVNGASSPIVVSGLTNGQAYTFSITANNVAGTGPASIASNSVTPKATQTITFNNPGPQNFGTTPTFSATADSGLTPTFTSSTTSVCTITAVGAVTFVTAGTCAINADQPGNGSYLAAPQIPRSFTVNAVVPGAPTMGVATLTGSTASVAFTAPVFNGGVAISQYEVMPSPVVSGGAFVGTGSPVEVTGLVAGQRYTFTVIARNSAGDSLASTASNAVVPMRVQTISFMPAASYDFGSTPVLSATSDSGLAVTLSVDGGSAGVCAIDGGGQLSFASVGTCTVHADQAGDSTHDPAARVSRTLTINAVVPGAPTMGSATLTGSTASVAFTAPVFNGGVAISQYEVMPSPVVSGGAFVGTGSPVEVTGLVAGQRYTFTVIARNSAGDSLASTASNAVVPMRVQTISFMPAASYDFGSTPVLSATSDSGLAVTLSVDGGSAGICAIDGAGQLSFASVGTCTVHADQAGDSTHDPAARVSRTLTINAVAPAAPTIGTAVAQGINAADVGFSAPASNGGAAINGYTVTASPGGATAAGTGSPIRITGLDPATSYTFTVTATNSAGTGAASGASNPVSTIPLLLVNDVSDTVAYGAAAMIGLSINGRADEVLVTSQPAHGTATASGISITYQPNPGYAGTDQFTYAAKDGYSTSVPARVDITVTAPTLTIATSSLPAARASTPYSQTLAASGGTGPYRYAVTGGRLPNGTQLSTAGALTGTPTEVGTFNVTITATDSSTGIGPFNVAQSYSLEVTAAEVKLDLDVLPPASGDQDYTQALTARGGTAPYRFTVTGGQLPPGLSLAADGTFSGEPEAAGSYTFALEVTDANGFTGTTSLTLTVELTAQAITAMATDPQAPVFVQGGTFTVSASGGGSGNPVQFSSGSPGVCSVAGAQVTMLAAGNCVLNADQAGNAMYQAAAQARLEVAIAAATPTLQWMDALTRVYGEAAFDVVDPRSDSQGAFTFSSSNAAVATVNGRTVTLVGAGTTTLSATQQAHGSYTAATVEVELTVSERPDPTLDAEVRGGLQAQVDASVRFARVQLGNIQARLQQVRSGDNPSSAALTLAYAGDLLGQGMSVPVKLPMNAWNGLPAGWGGWMSGTATFGDSGRQSGGDFDFRTDGISLGVDRAWGDSALMGMATSIGRNRSRFDHSPSRMDADQYSLALYGLWRSGEHLFVDGALAHGWLDFDMARWNEMAGKAAAGQRDGRQTFGALTFGYQQQRDRFSLAGYGRFDGSRTRLDGYREHGLGVYDLDYAAQTVSNSGLALGFDGSWSWRGERVDLRPFWKLEYRQSLSNSGDARINYVQQPIAGGYVMDMNSYADNMLTLGAGFDVQTRNGWLVSLLLGRDQGSNSASSNSVGLRVSYGKGGAGGMGIEGYSADGLADDCQGRRCRNRQMPGMARP